MKTEQAPQIMTQASLIKQIGRQLLEDSLDAGWIKPCSAKIGKVGATIKWYAVADWRQIENRILNGEYPGQ